MNLFRFFIPSFKRIKWFNKRKKRSIFLPQGGYTSIVWDTKTAIEELLKIAKRNTQDYEIFLALGNLYRAQGDIDKAVRLRYSLITKPHLDELVKGKVFYELGIDYKRGGLFDRAILFLERAKKLLGDDPAILKELAELNAIIKDFEKSAYYSNILNDTVAYAHYLVEQSKLELERGNRDISESLLKKAIDVYPKSLEGWIELVIRDYSSNAWDNLFVHLKKGLKRVPDDLRFVLMESIIQHMLRRKKSEIFSPTIVKEGAESIIRAVKKYDKEPVLLYYCAWFYLQIDKKEQALKCLRKSVTIDPKFWLARLEIISLTCGRVQRGEDVEQDIEILVNVGRNVKRFICNVCSFKTNNLFFICPRCNSWHTIRFRRYISG